MVDGAMNSHDPLGYLLDLAASTEASAIKSNKVPIFRKVIDKVYSEHLTDMNKELNRVIQSGYRICSFSERLDSLLLWSHYADQHKGIAIEYDFSQCDHSDIRSRCMWPVLYSENLFDASGYISQSRQQNFNNLFAIIAAMHKSMDWSYEQEWRLIIPTGETYAPFSIAVPKPSAIYLGSRISQSNKIAILDIANMKKIPVHAMTCAHNQFRMISKPLSEQA